MRGDTRSGHNLGVSEAGGHRDGSGSGRGLEARPRGEVVVCRLGTVDYRACCAIQRRIWEGVRDRALPDHLLLVEHPPVITAGVRGEGGGLLVDRDALEARGVELVHTDRGGELTYHGPGQLVAYPILNLAARARDVKKYVHNLEETVIRLCCRLGVEGAERRDSLPGVWVQGRGKVASVGLRISRWVTMHGVALNVMVDPAYFKMIVPCGIAGVEMVSLVDLLPGGQALFMGGIQDLYLRSFQGVFGGELVQAPDSYLKTLLEGGPLTKQALKGE